MNREADLIQNSFEEKIEIEDKGEFLGSVLINKDKLKRINKQDLKIATEEIFKESLWSSLGRMIKRKSIIYYNVTTIEKSLEIKDIVGTTNMQLITEQEIKSKINKIRSENDKQKIGYIAIGGIRIKVSSHLREGVDTPIRMALIDNRIKTKYREEALLGLVTGNLSYKTLIFTVYPRITMSLKDKHINRTFTLAYEYERSDLVHDGVMPINVNYVIAYALINSMNCELYKEKDFIEIEKDFKDLAEVYQPNMIKSISLPQEWDIDLNPKELLGAPSTSKRSLSSHEGRLVIRNNSIGRINSERIIRNEDSFFIKGIFQIGNKIHERKIRINTGIMENYINPEDIPVEYICPIGEFYQGSKLTMIIQDMDGLEHSIVIQFIINQKEEEMTLGLRFLQDHNFRLMTNKVILRKESSDIHIPRRR